MDLTVEVRAEGSGYWAHVVELPGCFASGQTLTELREALGEAVGLYLWDTPAELRDGELREGQLRVAVDPPQ